MDEKTPMAIFPLIWAGQEKNGIFVCGACASPEACLEARCRRATDEDFEQATRAIMGRRPS